MDYDAAWKRLFGLPIVVEHLIRGFAESLAAWLDFGTLRELSASWAGHDTEQRHGDAAWRVDYGDGSGRSLVLLLEFQSSVDQGMAERVLRYAGMAREALRRQGALDTDGELRVLSIVAYSGFRRWTAPGGIGRIGLSENGETLLSRPYLLLDVRRLAADHLPARNIVSTVFELDAAESPEEITARMRSLWTWLPNAVGSDLAGAVRHAIVEWLLMAPRLLTGSGVSAVLAELKKVVFAKEKTMGLLAERARQWEADWLRQGLEQGIQRGLAEERELLRRQAERKFDASTAEALARRIAAVADPVRLAEVGDLIIDCETGAGLLNRLRTA